MLNIEDIKKEIELLPADTNQHDIEITAKTLKGINYSPNLPIDTPDFLFITKDGIAKEFTKVANSTKDETLKKSHLNLLLHQYKFLYRLRMNDMDAWDEVNELYEDD